MYILSQNKELLMEFGRLEVCKNLTAKKDEKYVLSAWGRALANPVTVGMYPDEETAHAELRSIITALNMDMAVYEIK